MCSRTLLLVDGTFALYRAFFAIRGLSTRAGQPTNAVFGLVRMMHQLREQWKPTHWAVVLDGGAPARRLALLPEYKAQRPPMPAALRQQTPLAEEYLDCANVRRIRQERQEADDVMASLAIHAASDVDRVLLVTSDKDLFQMVGERVRILAAGVKGELLDAAAVRERTGVTPERVVDWLALVGDAVDNIPGVPGVGPKTAAKLIDRFGSAEGILARLDEVEQEKVRRSLAANRDQVTRNLNLVRLDTSLDVPLGGDDLRVVPEDRDRLLAFYERMEFVSLARALRQPDLFGSAAGG